MGGRPPPARHGTTRTAYASRHHIIHCHYLKANQSEIRFFFFML